MIVQIKNLAGLACIAWICGSAGIARGDYFVTLTENHVPTTANLVSSVGGIDVYTGTTADFVAVTTATDNSSVAASKLLTSFIVTNFSAQTETLSIEVEDTGPGNTGFANPTSRPLNLLAQVADPSLSGGDKIMMQSGLSLPVSGTPSYLTSPPLSLLLPGAETISNQVAPGSGNFALFSFLTFTLGPHASENVSATSAAIAVPEPRVWLSLLGLAGTIGLLWGCRLRRRVS